MAPAFRSQRLSGWGRYPTSQAAVTRPERQHEVVDALRGQNGQAAPLIARGAGKAYGDAALNGDGCVVSMVRLNRFIEFDRERGYLTCEAGVTLREALEVCVPEGWCLTVTPGTATATVGGCLACDVHGKNHHVVGSFSRHVDNAKILTAAGEAVTCSPDRESDLFWATAGGMGLTGIILEVTLRLQRIETAFISTRSVVTRDLEETFRCIEQTGSSTYSVAWLDGVRRGRWLGRGIVMLGEHAKLSDLPVPTRAAPLALGDFRVRSLPFGLPSALLGRPLALTFNEMVYRRLGATKPSLVEMQRYFYPLDALDNWNRLYGSNGFLEYQVILPSAQALNSVRAMLELLHDAGQVSFFTSLKQLGANSGGHISFPMPGYAFSFDVPAGNKAAMTLLDRCDDITMAAGGRVYLAKDARLSSGVFASMYPRHREWLQIVRRFNAAGMFGSDMSRRLELAA